MGPIRGGTAVLMAIIIISVAFNIYLLSLPLSIAPVKTKTKVVSCGAYESNLPELASVWTNTRPIATFRTNAANPLVICAEFYYYPDTNTTMEVDPLDYISITGVKSVPGGTSSNFSANSDFSITSTPETVAIGGIPNTNEGTPVLFTITARGGVSGIYNLNFGWLLPESVNCGHEFSLVSGNGQPDYSFSAGCIEPGNPFQSGGVISNQVAIEIMFAVNGTT
ncbi:MAG: hypothetical protein JRN06_06635 [Nitrososphaerota archaeon]|nr:hypothetical protein [Nitrososphaerota archaeon]MDG7024546.1 hypothetical protein [Nitrososphaerota archaeon]